MKNRESIFYVILIGAALFLDILSIILADFTSFFIILNGHFLQFSLTTYFNLLLLVLSIRCSTFYVFNLYHRPIQKSNFEVLINAIKACTVSSMIIIAYLYLANKRVYPGLAATLSWFLTIIFVSSWRAIIKEILGVRLGKDFLKSHLLIIGIGPLALKTAIAAQRNTAIDYKVLGFLAPENASPIRVKKSEILGILDNLSSILKKYHVDEVMLATNSLDEKTTAKLLQLLNKENIPLTSIPPVYETIIKNIVLYGDEVPFGGTANIMASFSWYWGVKRIFDLILSSSLLILAFPILFLAMVLIKVTSPGPVLYFQKRIGHNGHRFTIAKLRTMYIDAEKSGKPCWAQKDDKRITRVGKWLRRYRIDELPQLINVLKNEMSLIGPRPERPYFYSKLIKKIPFYAERLLVKPGLSGWAQVNFKYAASKKEAEEKLLYDLYYIQNMSLALDVLIALKTLKVIFTGKGAQ